MLFGSDPDTGLKCIIAIHSTVLGPSLGGTRFWNYNTEEEAINDVLRLSRGMTYKAAVSGLNMGGGKGVIIGNPYTDKSEMLWRRYGKFIESLNGRYITAEDVGVSTRDMEWVSMETDYVGGMPKYLGGSGDPSVMTAYGNFVGMKAGAKKVWGSDNLEGKKVLVQGVGHVGSLLCRHLAASGAEILISDIREEHLQSVSSTMKCTVVDPDKVYETTADIYAPCALGGTLNDETIPLLQCKLIAGAANNQLLNEDVHAKLLRQSEICYLPDFVINAGGIINIGAETDMGYQEGMARSRTEEIYGRVETILKLAEKHDLTTHEAAMKIAQDRITAMKKLKSSF